jgi:hypothetical protein
MEYICTYHDQIRELSKKLKKNTNPEIQRIGLEIYELVKKAKRAGIKMENRLCVYKDGIEDMGFVRKKRQRKKRGKQ